MHDMRVGIGQSGGEYLGKYAGARISLGADVVRTPAVPENLDGGHAVNAARVELSISAVIASTKESR